MQLEKKQQIILTGFFISIAGAVLFSTKAILVKAAFRDTGVNAVPLLALRMLFSLPFYVLAAWLAGRKESNKPLSKKNWGWIIVLGIVGYYLSSLFDFIGLQYISAGLERLILFLYPTFAVLINTCFFKVALVKKQVWALLLTYSGIGIAYFSEWELDTHNPSFYYGSFMVFLCAITYSFYIVGTGKLVHKAGVTRYTAYAMLSATAGIFIHYLITQKEQSLIITPMLIKYSLALAIIATVIPSFLMSNGMKRIGSNNVAIITSIGPVSTILQAYLFLGERITPLQIFGTILVLLGIVTIGWKTKTPEPNNAIP
jgi:drug/metabolite transporter (DMT)-like permease